jgi:long-chain fatty acid transport protein
MSSRRSFPREKWVFSLLFCTMMLSAQSVFAGYFNNYQYVIGERSAGMGGAYTSLADDSTALWYNPAGLARINDLHLNISATGFSYLNTKTEGFYQFPVLGGGIQSLDMEESDLSAVAHTLIYGKKIGAKQAFAFGIFLPYQDSILGNIQANALPALNLGSTSLIDDTVTTSKYYVGMLGYGVEATDRINIGASIGFGYYQADLSNTSILDVDDPSTSFQYLSYDKTHTTNTQYGMQAGLGAQYEINRNHKLGIYAQTPTWRISGKSHSTTISYSVNTTGYTTGNSWTEEDANNDPFKQALPGFISLGYGYEKPGSLSFSLDIIPIFPVADDQSGFYKNTVVNLKVGLEDYLSKYMIVRTGFFTDFSQQDNLQATANTAEGPKINYYGGTFSFSLGKHYQGTNKETIGNATHFDPFNITLWSTFGAVFRYGTGNVMVTQFDSITYNAIPLIQRKDVLNVQVFIAESISF